MSPKYLDIDFEFNNTKEPVVNLVCSAYKTTDGIVNSHWLHKDKQAQENLADELKDFIDQGYIIRAYAAIAEARCFEALGINPLKVQWIDMFLEYRNLMNHSDLQFGRQLIEGKIYRNPMHRYDKRFRKPEEGLAAAVFKLLDIQIDTERKNFMRDVIIDGRYVEKYKDEILEYCESDIKYMDKLFKEMVKIYVNRLPKRELKKLKQEMLLRGEYAARTAIMESIGYPINLKATRNFSKSVQDILNEIAEDINEQFPDILPFERNRATRKFVFKQNKAKEQIEKYCKENNIDSWDRSEKTGEYSLSVDAYSKFFHYRHDFPRGNYFAQVLRYKKAEQHMNGFKPKAKPINCWPGTTILKTKDTANMRRNTFFNYVGSDERVRPYFNIYGAQSSRSQPSATSFLFLKAAWMRSLCEPLPGKCVIGIDFGQQEFLLKGLVSGDKEMLRAYESGDVYLYFGKNTGGIPKDATKEHPLRDKYKSTTLGIQFLMTKFGLSKKLTNDTGEFHSEDDAQELIDDFNELYSVGAEHSEDIIEEYHNGKGYIKLPCGWTMWDRNPNDRSVANMPIQGFGGSIMRKAVGFAQDKGLDVIFTLHDAIYIECDYERRIDAIALLAEAMDEGFRFYFEDKSKANIRLDADVWGPDCSDKKYEVSYCDNRIPVKEQKIYIDGRSKEEYKKFNKYFEDRLSIHLL